MTDELAFLDATAQAELVRKGDATPLELTDAAISRIEALDPQLNVVVTPLFEKARQGARDGLPDGPFRGVPMVLKDLTAHSAGDPLYEGTRFLREAKWVEDEDSILAARFRAAGLVFLAKANTPELGILPTTEPDANGPTRNPWDTARSTGGSSGGPAAAVASGMVPIAHANDGGGSIRIPASECGLVGLKPSRARTSLGPHFGDVMSGLPCEHVVTRSVRDTAAILDAVSGPAPGDPYQAPRPSRPFSSEVGADPGRLKVGIWTSPPPGTSPHPDCLAAAEGAARLLESLGHHVERSHPAALDDPDFTLNFVAVWTSGTAWVLDYWSRMIGRVVGPEDVETLTWAVAEMARSYTAPQYLSAIEWCQAFTRRVASWYADGFDLLVSPTLAEPPPRLGEFASPPSNPLNGLFRAGALVPFTPAFNVTGQPAVSLPLSWNADGLPIGVQLTAAYGREDVLIRVASQLEESEPWSQRHPPVSAG